LQKIPLKSGKIAGARNISVVAASHLEQHSSTSRRNEKQINQPRFKYYLNLCAQAMLITFRQDAFLASFKLSTFGVFLARATDSRNGTILVAAFRTFIAQKKKKNSCGTTAYALKFQRQANM
jgi:hypothetical protein